MKHSLPIILLFISIVVFASSRDWRPLLSVMKAEGNIEFKVPWGGNTRPLVFVLQENASGRMVRLDLSDNGWTAQEIFEDGRSVELPPVRMFPGNLPKCTADIVFKIREDDWAFFVNGKLRGTMAAPFAMPGQLLWPRRPGVKLASQIRFLPVPRSSFKSDFMIEPGAPNELYPWQVRTGTWHIHTAKQQSIERKETDQNVMKRTPPTADKSPNFYSLKGGGKNEDAVITSGYDFYDNYSLSCSLQLEEGEAGILFYHREQSAASLKEGEAPDPAKADFYAYTIRMERPYAGNRDIRLWKQEGGKRTVLARASVPLFKNQWYLPEIKVTGNEIVCLLDRAELFRVREQLPLGGKYGMYANTPVEIRFDDVTVEHYSAFDLSDMPGIAHNTLFKTPGFEAAMAKVRQNAEDAAYVSVMPKQPVFCLAALEKDEMLLLGRRHNRGECLEATISKAQGEFGLVAGWRGGGQPYYLFRISRDAAQDKCQLLKVNDGEPGKVTVLDEYTVPALEPTVRMMVDSTQAGILRCYRDGRLMHFLEAEAPFTGASGFWLAQGSSAAFSDFTLATVRHRQEEQLQKVAAFQNDPFMKHWASPQGQWINAEGGILWHKGDFFGDFNIQIPLVDNSELHLAVPDGGKQGAVCIKVSKEKLKMNASLLAGESPQEIPNTFAGKVLEIVNEGNWLWLKVEGKTILKQRLDFELKSRGTRVMAKGMSFDHMNKSRVLRTNVLDEFFNESPHDWLANGGDWQIINRFQCTQSWSHMIGETPNALGAFWLKRLFHGDMTLEFYAGTRHNYYDKAGNLNCTIMATDTTPSSGYTFTCTEWDQNLSQNWNRMYRNGICLKSSDAYTVPRRRKGQYRKNYNPLIARGRDIHGAWYYVKIRKIGKKLEYYFDDELILTQDDEQPLQDGLVGIWTFDHSMTLAQIKITFEDSKVKPVPVTLLPTEEPTPPQTKTNPQDATAGDFPLNATDGAFWTYSDLVNQGKFSAADGVLQLQSTLGGGAMKIESKLPPLPLDKLAGWHFKVKRSSRAQFNFFYYLGNKNDKGAFSTVRSLFHHISGDEFPFEAWRMSGDSVVPPVSIEAFDGQDGWVDLYAWIPTKFRTSCTSAKIGGFGIEQLDGMQMGITGNGPGERYAIRELTPVFYGMPDLKNAQIGTVTEGKFGMKHAECTANGKTYRLDWIEPPTQEQMSLKWDDAPNDAVIWKCETPYPDLRFKDLNFSIAGHNLIFEREYDESVHLYLPRQDYVLKAIQDGKLPVTVKYSGKSQDIPLDLASPIRHNRGPVLEDTNGPCCIFQSFDGDNAQNYIDNKGCPSEGRVNLGTDSPKHGNYLHIRNRNIHERLNYDFKPKVDNAKFPLAQFIYRAYDMDYVSMIFRNGYYAQLKSGDDGRAKATRCANDLMFDEKWHTWTGFVTDAFSLTHFTPNFFKNDNVRIASLGNPSQTGRHSQIDLDDITFGPAVRTPEQLFCKPKFFDFDGVAEIHATILQGEKASLESQNAEYTWVKFAPGAQVQLSFPESMQDGVHHFLLRAIDNTGRKSPIYDIPFLLDRKPVQPSHKFAEDTRPELNGTHLEIKAHLHGGSPLCIDKVKFALNGKNVEVPYWGNQFQHCQDSSTIVMNYPMVFSQTLDKAKEGDILTLKVSGIQDGAGNVTEDYSLEYKVDYSKDKRGPAWYDLKFGPQVPLAIFYDGSQCQQIMFRSTRNNALDIAPSGLETSAHLQDFAHYGGAEIVRDVKWKPFDTPYLSMRLAMPEARPQIHMQLILYGVDGKNYTISLNKPGNGEFELNRDKTYTWEARKWQSLHFNLKEMLRKIGVKDEQLKNIEFKHLAIRRWDTNHRERLWVDDVYLAGPPEAGKQDLLTWKAFDASGVAGLEAIALGDDGKELWKDFQKGTEPYDLNRARNAVKKPHWLQIRAKDFAGNYSYPLLIPID